jgi:hypothetical protein
MRILNDKSDMKLNTVSLFLTKTETLHLIGYLEQLVDNKSSDHSHLMSEDFKKEITVCVYDPEHIENFHPRIQKLIKSDE